MGRIIVIICIILLVVGGVWWWHNYHSGSPYDGSIIRRDAAMENGTTTMENGQNIGSEARPTPSRSDAPGTINGDPINAPTEADLDTQTTPITKDPYTSYGPNPYGSNDPNRSGPNDPNRYGPNGGNPNAPPPPPQVTYNNRNQPYYAPYSGTDSQPPDAPNGLRFSGSGSYQWYRQGNVTYRVDTRTGSSCIIYATVEEWRKPYVYRHGCRY